MIAVCFGIAATGVFTLLRRTPDSGGGIAFATLADVAGVGVGIWQWSVSYGRITGAVDDKVSGTFPALLAGWPALVVLVVLIWFIAHSRRGSYGW